MACKIHTQLIKINVRPGHAFSLNYLSSLQVDGVQSFSIGIKQIEDMFARNNKYWRDTDVFLSYTQLEVSVVFTETLTSKEMSASVTLPLKTSRVALQFVSYNPASFKPGLDLVSLVSACLELWLINRQ